MGVITGTCKIQVGRILADITANMRFGFRARVFTFDVSERMSSGLLASS